MGTRTRLVPLWIIVCLFSAACPPVVSHADEIPPSEYWKNQIVFPDDAFRASGTFEYDPGWVKFTVLLEPRAKRTFDYTLRTYHGTRQDDSRKSLL